jgi:hypothetical protein
VESLDCFEAAASKSALARNAWNPLLPYPPVPEYRRVVVDASENPKASREDVPGLKASDEAASLTRKRL